MKSYFLILIFPFIINCSTLKSLKNTKEEQRSGSTIPSMHHFDKADTNKDNVIDKNESIKFYNKNNSINYSSPLYIFAILSGGVLFICFWPLIVSYFSSLIQRLRKPS